MGGTNIESYHTISLKYISQTVSCLVQTLFDSIAKQDVVINSWTFNINENNALLDNGRNKSSGFFSAAISHHQHHGP